MKKLTETLKQMLNALAYEDAGEYLTPRQKTKILNQIPGPGRVAQAERVTQTAASNSKHRRVALYLGSELPAEVMTYVVQTCANLQHDLTVLTFQIESTARSLLQPHETAMNAAGINMRLVQLSGDPSSALPRYLKGHPEIAFLACKDSGYLGWKSFRDSQGKNLMPVPVVVVETGKAGADSLDKSTTAETNDSANVA